jgi:eukaryotic-like serine/threonine-protein kinase
MSHSDDTTRVQGDGLFDGRYRFIEKIGQGGMAKVFLAEDVSLHRKVAIKVLGERYAEDAQFVERFQREARAAAGLNHPNIVQVYDHGRANGSYYIAMEYLEGPTLDEAIAEEGHLPPRRAIDLTLQILAALRFAHRHGVVHRDVKPQNMILLRDGRVKVTDFGIARAGSSEMTEAGSIIGTAQYISPEQARGLPVGPPADLYSVGVVLYKMLTGRVPFDGESAVAVAMRHVQERPVPPSHLNPDVPPDLERVVMRALAKDVERRYQTADEMGIDLDRVRKGLGVSQQTAVVTGATRVASYVPPPPPPEQTYYREPPPPPDDRRGGGSRWWVWLFVLLLIGAALALGYIILSGGDDDGTPGTSSAETTEATTTQETTEATETTAEQVQVPAVTDLLEEDAVAALEQANLTPRIVRVFSQEPIGVVLAQNPQAGAEVLTGTQVRLNVSKGVEEIETPDVVNQPVEQAQQALADAGLKVEVTEQPSDTVPEGAVISQAPQAGVPVAKNSTVRLVVSSGPEQPEVPNVINQSEGEARAAIQGLGLGVDVAEQSSSTIAAGNVIDQDPAPGTRVQPGSTVRIVVSSGPESVPVPGVVGLPRDEAVTVLEDAGLRPNVQTVNVADPTQDGLVIAQAPEMGSTAVAGDRVRINVGRFFGNTDTTPTETEPVTT